MQPESSDGFASVGTILPEERAAPLPGGSFRLVGILSRLWGFSLGLWRRFHPLLITLLAAPGVFWVHAFENHISK